MQNVSGYANDFLDVIQNVYGEDVIPTFFSVPTEGVNKEIWDNCLKSCKDYYGEQSAEYRLLIKGIVVHYGKMPGLLSRLLIEVISKRIVHIVLASSTLSEGVNLPFDIIIVPFLTRIGKTIPVGEFTNLIGRTGRPGSGTEGRSLIFLEGDTPSISRSSKNARDTYEEILSKVLANRKENKIGEEENISSSVAKLISYIKAKWQVITDSTSSYEFDKWLETCVPSENTNIFDKDPKIEMEQALDTFDAILISSIAEYESLRTQDITKAELEMLLKDTWKSTYAYFTSKIAELEDIYVNRGKAIFENIYPKKTERRKIYKTGLQPRFASQLFQMHDHIVAQLKAGFEYRNWSVEDKIKYIISCVNEITYLKKFEIKEKVGRGKNAVKWEDVLFWWLSHNQSPKKPNNKNISEWIKFVYDNFTYKFKWGLGTVISLQMEKVEEDDRLKFISLDDWPDTELPWIVFWIKELITWGTYDPVVAFLLSSNVSITREDASILAQNYYNEVELEDDIFNPKLIRKWIKKNFASLNDRLNLKHEQISIDVKTTRKKDINALNNWRIFPKARDNKIYWLEYGGYLVAESNINEVQLEWLRSSYEFTLDESVSKVIIKR